MERGDGRMVNIHDLTEDMIKDRFSWVFRKYVGYRRQFSVEQVAELTGINSRTVESWRAGDSCPTLWNLLRLCSALPDSFTNELLGLAGMTGAHNADGAELTEHELMDLLATEVAWFTGVLRDGIFCHLDRRELEARWPKFVASVNAASQHINARVVADLQTAAE